MTIFNDIYDNMYNKVREFHDTFGLPIQNTTSVPEESIVQLRHDLLKEEYLEYVEGMIEDDVIEIADALADILYIAFGSALVYGLRPKAPAQGSTVSTEEDYRFFLSLYNNRHTVDGYNFWLNYVIEWALERAYELEIPIIAVFNEVHRSNMSKLTAEGTVLYREDGKVLKSDLYSPPDIRGVLYNYSKITD